MGSGKTSAAIQMMNDNPKQKYLFVTPYLKEVKRIKDACPDLHFTEPRNYDYKKDEYTKKVDHIRSLLEDGRNVATTHALFSIFDTETLELIERQGYNLVLDEVLDVVDTITLGKKDLGKMLDTCTLEIGENDRVYWHDTGYEEGLWSEIKDSIEVGELYQYTSTLFIQLLPVDRFSVFQDVYILTFMFEAQDQWALFKMKNIDFEYIGVKKDGERYLFTDDLSHVLNPLKGIKKKIEFCGEERYEIGDPYYAFSSTSFNGSKKNANDPFYQELRACADYMRRRGFDTRDVLSREKKSVPVNEIMWTCYKNVLPYLESKRISETHYVPCNARGENQWGHKTHLIYLVNRFRMPPIKNFFFKRGIILDDDDFALSEMVQWIWRSAIRNGKKIKIYIPSSRMRRLLEDWLDKVS